MTPFPHQQGAERHIRQHGNHTDLHRSAGILAGIEARRQYLDQHGRQQAGAVGTQGFCGFRHIQRSELAVLEKRGQQRLGQHCQRQCCRQTNQQHHADGPIQGSGKRLAGGIHMLAGQAGQDHRADRHRKNPQRQLDQPVGVVEPGHRPRLQQRRQHRIDQGVELIDRRPEQGRHHQCHDLAHPRVGPAHARHRHQIQPGKKR